MKEWESRETVDLHALRKKSWATVLNAWNVFKAIPRLDLYLDRNRFA